MADYLGQDGESLGDAMGGGLAGYWFASNMPLGALIGAGVGLVLARRKLKGALVGGALGAGAGFAYDAAVGGGNVLTNSIVSIGGI